MSIIDVIIPTFENPNYLYPCVNSLVGNRATVDLFKIIIVNNGHPEYVKDIKHPDVTILQMKENKGDRTNQKQGFAPHPVNHQHGHQRHD